MTRVLVFSTLYPNGAQPNHGVFVETRLRETVACGGLTALVVAPVPYFPSSNPIFGRYAAFAAAPAWETRHGLEVHHPRYATLPKVGPAFAPVALYRAGLRAVRRLQARGERFDVIDAHYLYPDAAAARRLAQTLQLPLVITARGSDVTQLAQEKRPAEEIRAAAAQASASVAVCEDLRRRLVKLGAPAERTITLRNGVDLAAFVPQDRARARTAMRCEGYTLLSVGALIPRKGHDLTIRALQLEPEWRLMIAGSGPLRGQLEALARDVGVADRVRFLGEVPHAQLAQLYSAADAMVLASSREGWANVLLEAMACGTPVVATDVNGAPEVVRAPAAGVLVHERSPEALAAGVRAVKAARIRRLETRLYAEEFGWRQIAMANAALLKAAAEAGYAGRYDPGILGAANSRLNAQQAAEPAARQA